MTSDIRVLPGTSASLSQIMNAKPRTPAIIEQDGLGIVYSSKIDWKMWDKIPTTMLDLEYFNQAHPESVDHSGLLDIYM